MQTWSHSARQRAKSAPAPRLVRVLDGDDIAEDVARRVVSRVLDPKDAPPPRLDEVAYETIYAEETRLSHAPRAPRSAADHEFVAWLRRELARSDEGRRRELVEAIVARYVAEISGHFDGRVYGVATRLVPTALSVLLHGFRRGQGLADPTLFDVNDRIVVDGEVESLRALVELGTVILAPTHVSNLDSLVLGSSIYQLGLPPFAYGAGLNLFSNGLIGFFMQNLGAYTVDRKKSDPLYRIALKEYVAVLLERGQHNLFFPGGTRSRSGAIETHLKLGLLGTAPAAYRRALAVEAPRNRIFIVPCTLTYPLVLEAATLIEDYLRAEGGAHYVDVRDEFDRPKRWLDFLNGLMNLDQRVHLTIGRPLDVVGNEVDRQGISRDPRGRPIQTSRYFAVAGRMAADAARDAAYTRLVASRLAAAYRRDNLALPTTVTAFVAFSLLRREGREPDLFRFLRSLSPDASVGVEAVLSGLDRALGELRVRADASEIRIHDSLRRASPRDALEQALRTFATYHPTPVIERRGDRIVAADANLLCYYRNRLSGYGLLGEPEFLAPERPGTGGWPS